MPASLLTVTPLTASGISHVFDNIPYGPVAWFDASKISGIASGTSLSAWTDVSGSGSHVTQPSAASQPVFVTNGLNGLPVIQFNGGQTLAGPDLDLLTTGHTLAAVSSFSTAPSGVHYTIVSKGINSAGQQYSLQYQNATNVCGYFFFTGASQRISAASTANSANSFKALATVWDNTTYSHYRGTAGDGSTTTSAVGAQQNQSLIVGGANDASSSFLKGNIAEVVIYNRALATNEIVQLQTYLTTKWAV